MLQKRNFRKNRFSVIFILYFLLLFFSLAGRRTRDARAPLARSKRVARRTRDGRAPHARLTGESHAKDTRLSFAKLESLRVFW